MIDKHQRHQGTSSEKPTPRKFSFDLISHSVSLADQSDHFHVCICDGGEYTDSSARQPSALGRASYLNLEDLYTYAASLWTWNRIEHSSKHPTIKLIH